jgi:membrane-associated phospholipid phosphatase
MKRLLTTATLSLACIGQSFGFGGYERVTDRGYPVNSRDAVYGNIGDWLQLAIPISAAIYSSAISDWEGVKQLSYATGSTFLTTETLKRVVHEERPYQKEGTDGVTFPSGHTSFAFAGATYWQRRYGWTIGAPMYAAAAFVGYSRVRVKMHNWADVIGGATIGIGFNLLFTSKYRVSVQPTDGGAELRFKTKF